MTEEKIDYEGLGLKVGIELHRQLKVGGKLFCSCKPGAGDSYHGTFMRMLRPTESELGEVDPAARFEAARGLEIIYRYNVESSCLVEADEEPPHDVNMQAVETALMIALMLNAKPVDEIHVMRKIVIDGSNTTGFQRTMIIALGGWLKVGGRVVGVQTITLEEDAARLVGTTDGSRVYDLGRLGIPLIEVSLEPIEVRERPQEVVEVAEALGRLLKSTGRVARGLGTVRQDLNISIRGSGIVEVKGVQELPLIAKVVDYEAKRLKWLMELADELRRGRGVTPDTAVGGVFDVTDILRESGSRLVKKALGSEGRALAILARGFSGLIGKEPYPDVRLGRELADIARAYGLGGVLHSDELPGYGLTVDHVNRVKERVGAGEGDAFVIVMGDERRVRMVVDSICDRLRVAVVGPPSETRASTPDGKTRYLRPRPGAARMYPETDIPLIKIDEEMINRVRASLPPPWDEQVRRIQEEYGISRELAEQVLDSEHYEVFTLAVKELGVKPSIAAVTVTETLTALRREGLDVSKVSDDTLLEVLRLVSSNEIAKEAVPDVLRLVIKEGVTVKEAVGKLGLRKMSSEELKALIKSVINENLDLVRSRRERAFGPLMGIVMSKVRGRADGSVVSKTLRELILEALKS